MRTFTFNDIRKDFVIPLFGNNREPWAPIERQYQDVPGRAGVYMRNKRVVKQRNINVPVLIHDLDTDYNELKEELAEWLIHDEPKPLVFDDEPNRIYYAVVDGAFNPEDIVTFGKGTIPFVCPNPYKYGYEESIILGNYPIRNEGTVEASPIFSVKFSAAASEFTFTNDKGKFVRIIFNFVANDLLVVDMDKRKITINNNVRMTTLDLNSTWFSLQPGNNVITVSSGATTTIIFSPRWL
ncbi:MULTISPECIES: distal tail protein Dit [Peribacillus]|uniref:distal tail protein Dit n=1 Tax=Peribacillus TaxID=2675229 RepID=UPI001F4DD6A0|nr:MULTISPECIES: distal tail protein Dit [unclassified Peribacillus]MCK1982236.1 phage tail family protein [Peribacillus sp. Aquil_B1]MCK2007412.1 phage tail family protein [Peribacillus sp. Aquil_B8]